MKPGGSLGIAGAGLTQEIVGSPPAHLARWWTPDLWCLHSAQWWQRHWERTGLLAVDVAELIESVSTEYVPKPLRNKA